MSDKQHGKEQAKAEAKHGYEGAEGGLCHHRADDGSICDHPATHEVHVAEAAGSAAGKAH